MKEQKIQPAHDVREALADVVKKAIDDAYSFEGHLDVGVDAAIVAALTSDPRFEVRPRGTVTEADRLEYTIAAVSDNGAVSQLADYTTVAREHLKADLELYRLEHEQAECDPEQIIIAERPIPRWVRS